MREAAYKGLVRPILEYGSSVWDPHYEGLIDDLEKVQKRTARFVTRNYTYEKGSMTGILKKLKWESLQKRRKDNRIISVRSFTGMDRNGPDYRNGLPEWTFICVLEYFSFGLLGQICLGRTQTGFSSFKYS